MPARPGGELASRPLHFFWIIDCSGSMQNEKIQTVNTAIKEAIPAMRTVAQENVNAKVLVRALGFSTGTRWIISTPTAIEQFEWTDITIADGVTDMGAAMRELAKQLHMPPMSERALPPAIVLLSDGQPTDDFNSGLKELLDLPWGRKAIRIAIVIGHDCDRGILQKFIANPEYKPLEANSSGALAKQIKWASTVAIQAASSPTKQGLGALPESNTSRNTVTAQKTPPTSDDVW